MKDKDGKEHTHNITDDTVLMLDNKKTDVSTFKTLKEGTKIRVWLDKNDATKVTKIECSTRTPTSARAPTSNRAPPEKRCQDHFPSGKWS